MLCVGLILGTVGAVAFLVMTDGIYYTIKSVLTRLLISLGLILLSSTIFYLFELWVESNKNPFEIFTETNKVTVRIYPCTCDKCRLYEQKYNIKIRNINTDHIEVHNHFSLNKMKEFTLKEFIGR